MQWVAGFNWFIRYLHQWEAEEGYLTKWPVSVYLTFDKLEMCVWLFICWYENFHSSQHYIFVAMLSFKMLVLLHWTLKSLTMKMTAVLVWQTHCSHHRCEWIDFFVFLCSISINNWDHVVFEVGYKQKMLISCKTYSCTSGCFLPE